MYLKITNGILKHFYHVMIQ